MKKCDLKGRTKKFALDIIHMCNQLPKGVAFSVFSRQLIRCSSSIGANYRAAKRAKSDADFINKLKIVEEETDETIYFLELLKEVNNKNKEIAILKMEDTEFSINPSWIKDHEAIEISIQASYEENEKSERPSVKIILSQNGIEGISHED